MIILLPILPPFYRYLSFHYNLNITPGTLIKLPNGRKTGYEIKAKKCEKTLKKFGISGKIVEYQYFWLFFLNSRGDMPKWFLNCDEKWDGSENPSR